MVMANGDGEGSPQADFPPGMAPKMLNMLKVMDKLEKELDPLISNPYHEVLQTLSPIEKAKIGMMEVYGINSLFWVLMKTSGEDIKPNLRENYKLEMTRLKETQERIAELEARAHMQRVDKKAADRFIKRGLGMRTDEAEEEGEAEKTKRKPRKKKRV